MAEKDMVMLFAGAWVGIGIIGGAITIHRWWRCR